MYKLAGTISGEVGLHEFDFINSGCEEEDSYC